MEAAPLTLAHNHARNAVLETQKSNHIAASEEHDLAAGEFSNASRVTEDLEALRILRLLEQHHSKLAELLKFKPEEAQNIPSPTDSSANVEQPDSPTPIQTPAGAKKALESSPRHISQHPGVSQPLREVSSSIASNLASARGIPPSRQKRGNQSLAAQLSPQTAEGRVVRPHRRSNLGEYETSASDVPPRRKSQSPSASRVSLRDGAPPPITSTATEDPFSRFYSTFNNLITTLSAPLAFAGLPLNPSEAAPAQQPPKSRSPYASAIPRRGATSSSAAAADLDLTRHFSKAALRAVREENGGANLLAPAAPPHESFYFVPPSGGTISYAQMLTHARGASNLTDDGDEPEFVDARETPPPFPRPGSASPRASRHGTGSGTDTGSQAQAQKGTPTPPLVIRPGDTHAGGGVMPAGGGTVMMRKTVEELVEENRTLKALATELGDRLRAFELGAQKSSLALHASMRAFSSPTASAAGSPGGGKGGGTGGFALPDALAGLGSASPPPPMPAGAGGIKVLEERIRELEGEVKGLKKENRKLGKENQKFLGVIERYRERWEILKEGARERVRTGEGREGAVADE